MTDEAHIAGSTPFRRALVVVNPISGRGRAKRAAEELVEGLRQRGVSVELYTTQARGDAFTRLRTLTARDASQGQDIDLVVAVGGDGTLREVLDGLVDPTLPVALLPTGTANVLAQELGLPRDVHHHLEILGQGKVREVDVARANGRLCLLMTGVGFDARAVAEVEKRRTGAITKAHYVGAGFRAMRGYRAPELEIRLDGGEEHRAGFVIVSNAESYAGCVRLSSEARMDDGLLEVYLFRTGRVAEVLWALFRGVLSRLAGPGVEMHRAREVSIRCEEPVPYQVDGDLAGETPVEISLAKNRYHIVAP